jgi:uncharacterized membrane protein YccC
MLDGRSSWGKFWDSVWQLHWEKASPWMGLRNAAGVAAPVVIGAAAGALPAGLSAAIGALNVGFADSGVPYFKRAQRMLAACAITAISVFAGALCGHYHLLTLPAAVGWAFAAGMLVALDQTAADLGTISLVTLLVFAGLAMPPDRAMAAAALAFAGGLLQTALSVASWPIRRYGPERRALAALFEALADSASSSARASEPPPTTAQSTHAQETHGTLDRDRSVEAERFRALLSQAERMRIALLTLSRLRVRIERETPGSAAVAAMDRFLSLAADTLRSLAAERPTVPSGEMRQLVESLRCLQGETECDARRQMDALAGQLRAAADLADGAVPEGAARFARREASRSWRLRLKGTLATLRANFSLDSAACRHAIRLAVCVGIGEILGRVLGLTRSYWAPMTIAIVLKPDFGGTIRTGVLRFAGTFAGLGLATALFHLSPPGTRLEIALLGLAVFFARAYGAANYGIAATNITAMVVLLQALAGVTPNDVVWPRALNTVTGGTLALAAYAIWPTWERHRLGETLARMLEAYRDYFHQIRRAYENPGRAPAELDHARLAARRARTNLEASVDRLAAEPGTPPDRMRVLGGLLANSHRLAHAMMALEAGLQTRPAPARPQFSTFGRDVETTLARLAGALRGSSLDPRSLPDLREDHDALLASGQSENERYALVNVETDRIVNSLNTLGVDVAMWSAA